MNRFCREMMSVCLLVGAAVFAPAGTVIQLQETDLLAKTPGQVITIYVDAGKLRFEEGYPAASPKIAVIFDRDKQMRWILFGEGTYMEFTEAQVRSMTEQMQATQDLMRQAVQQQTANLPPDQLALLQRMKQQIAIMPPEERARMEEQIMAQGGDAPPKTVTVQETAKDQKVGQFTCTRYDVMAGGIKTEELCAADPAQIKLDPDAALRQIQGFPVQRVIFSGSQPSKEWDLVKIENGPLDSNLFVVPANWNKIEMPWIPAMGGGPPR